MASGKNEWNSSPVAKGHIFHVRQLSFQHDMPSLTHGILSLSTLGSRTKSQRSPTLLRNASRVNGERLKAVSTTLRYLPRG